MLRQQKNTTKANQALASIMNAFSIETRVSKRTQCLPPVFNKYIFHSELNSFN